MLASFGLFLLAFVYLIHRQMAFLAESFSDYLLKFCLALIAHLLLTGVCVSALHEVAQPFTWGVVSIAFAIGGLIALQRSSLQPHFNLINEVKSGWATWKYHFLSVSSTKTQVLFLLLAAGLAVTTLINLVLLLTTYPNEWDSMTGHLVKCAYYLQNGTMSRVGGTIWSIDFYPNSITSLQLYFYHLAGEKGFKIPHYIAYWGYVTAIYGISRLFFQRVTWAIASALLAALLPTALVQATTTETDLVLTFYLALIVYFLAKYYRDGRVGALYFAVLAGSIALGHKITFVMLGPSVLILFVFIIAQKKIDAKHWMGLIFTLGLGLTLFMLPMGYIGNVQAEGSFSISSLTAPKEVLAYHGIGNYTTQQKIENFYLNAFRYLTDFWSLDGFRNFELGEQINRAFRWPVQKVANKLQLERDAYWVVYPFRVVQEGARFYIERPYWGVIGVFLVLPVFLLGLFTKKVGTGTKLTRVLAVAALLQFLLLSFTAPFDPIKGRYFLSMSVWCLPIVGFFYDEWKTGIGVRYVFIITLFVVVSAWGTVFKRSLLPLFPSETTKSILQMNRLEQLTVSRPELYSLFARFDELVPKEAIVALGTDTEDFEYPFWGASLQRKLIPIHPFKKPLKPIPSEAEYLIFTEGIFTPISGDILLNSDYKRFPSSLIPVKKYYLRKL